MGIAQREVDICIPEIQFSLKGGRKKGVYTRLVAAAVWTPWMYCETLPAYFHEDKDTYVAESHC
jgi:hypothetical protein